MHHTSTLIIGQGLCGTWLSYWLQQENADYIIIDENNSVTSTKVASGIINPVTGRRMVKTWMADELIPFAEQAYKNFGDAFDFECIRQCDILDFFSAPDRRLSFEKRSQVFEAYLNWPEDEHAWLYYFDYPFGYGIVSPAYQVQIQSMLQRWRKFLLDANKLVEEKYQAEALKVSPDGIEYKDIKAERIVFCDGAAVMGHHFFTALPFAVNKGEALIVSIPGLPSGHIYKKTNTITPWKDELFWVGSSYDREYTDEKPSQIFRQQMEQWLRHFLKLPFAVEDHLSALRPTTVERRPFVGMHPHHPSVGIFNGMGTKGVSLAPYFGKQLADHLLHQKPIMPEVDVKQYSRALQRF